MGPLANFCSLYIKFIGLQNLIQHNQQLYSSGNSTSGGVALPFILVQVKLLTLVSSLVVVLILAKEIKKGSAKFLFVLSLGLSLLSLSFYGHT